MQKKNIFLILFDPEFVKYFRAGKFNGKGYFLPIKIE
tara:strand:+ start:44 stop:154 length:111 start_codon:yes stop_codon:yes gene_type:complete